MREEQRQIGIAELTARLNRSGLNLVEQSRPWPNRLVTYFEIGRSDQATQVVLSDEFVCDLPRTLEYQKAVDTFATAVAGRIRCGHPNLFYCLSNVAISLNINWPIQSAVLESRPVSWLLVDATDESNGKLARCCVRVNTHFAYSDRTTLDEIRLATNTIRSAIDTGEILFHDVQLHPDNYQEAKHSPRRSQPRTQSEVEKFIVKKALMLGFQIPEAPSEVWASDPWDAEYLGVSKKELSQSAYVARARGLINLDLSLSFARPSDKLITTGLEGVFDETAPIGAQTLTLPSLPRKENLLADLTRLFQRNAEIGLVVIDLDRFKQVNDTKGHPEGDACLERVVKAIGGALGRKGILYRWGGDEFAIPLPDFSIEEAAATAERIRKAVEDAKAGGDIPVTASIGVCESKQFQDANPETLLNAADRAMYVSKRNGKNRVTLWKIELDKVEKDAGSVPTP